MNDGLLWFVFYLFAGLIWVRIEHTNFDFDFEGLPTHESVIAVLQLIVHYTRGFLVWPLYMVEDFLIYLDNRREEE